MCLKLNGDMHPDMVILSVNALQKDLCEKDALKRGIALRTTVSIESHAVSEGTLQAIKRGSADSSVYVRKCAAGCVLTYLNGSRQQSSDEELDEIMSILDRLLGDYEVTVVSIATMGLWKLASKSETMKEKALSMLHPHFLRLVSVLPSMDWVGQYFLTYLLRAYSLTNFSEASVNAHFVSFLETLRGVVGSSRSAAVVSLGISTLREFKHEHEWSVILAKNLHATPPSMTEYFLDMPNLVVKKVKPFLVNTFSDSNEVKCKKIKILINSLSEKNSRFLLDEFSRYIHSTKCEVVVNACLDGVLKVGKDFPTLNEQSLNLLIACVSSGNSAVSNLAVHALRSLVMNTESDAASSVGKRICMRLSNLVFHGKIADSKSKASALWLIRVCHDSCPEVVLSVASTLGRTLVGEDSIVQLEAAALARTVLVFHEKTCSESLPKIRNLANHIFAQSSRDKIIGDIANVISTSVVPIRFKHSFGERTHPPSIASAKFVVRPEEDTPDSLRQTAKSLVKEKAVCFTSQESSGNRMSCQSVTVASSIRSSPPKIVQSLEDLDIFFSTENETPNRG